MGTCAVAVFVATLVVSIHCRTVEEENKIRTIHRECQDDPKTHVDEDILTDFQQGQHVDKSVIGAHMLCRYTKFGLISQEGKFNKSVLKKILVEFFADEAKLNDAVEKCAVETGDAQDKAVGLLTCLRKQDGTTEHHRRVHH